MEPLRGEVQGEVLGHWGHGLEEDEGPWSPVRSLSDILAMKKYFTRILCCATRPYHNPQLVLGGASETEPTQTF